MNTQQTQLYREISKYKFYLFNTLKFSFGNLPFYKEMASLLDKEVHEYFIYEILRLGDSPKEEYESLERVLTEIDNGIGIRGFPLYNYSLPVTGDIIFAIQFAINENLKDRPTLMEHRPKILNECKRFHKNYESEIKEFREIHSELFGKRKN